MAPRYPKPNQPTKRLILIFDPKDMPTRPNRPGPKPAFPQFGPQEMPRFPLEKPTRFLRPSPLPTQPKKYQMPWWFKPRYAYRALPYVGWGLLGWELYNWWRSIPGQPAGYDMTGWTQVCKNDWVPNPACAAGPYTGAGVGWATPAVNTPQCATALQVFQVAYGSTLPTTMRRTFYFGPIQPLNNCSSRYHIQEHWTRPDLAPPPVWKPEVLPIPAPGFMPDPMPWPGLFPDDLPIHQPVLTPRPLPYRDIPKAEPKPQPSPKPLPAVRPSERPSLDVTPGRPPAPRPHEVRPPRKDEKERKGKLRPGQAARWMRALDGMINKYTEMDDVVSAVYKALPWEVRCWKGRDGVWRDRDHLTHLRAQRIAQYADQLSIGSIVENLIENQVEDLVGGVIGELGKRAINANDYYRGLEGLQSGQRFTRDTWDETLHQLRLGAAQAEQPRDYYRYRRDSKVKWERYLVKGRRQMIPWLQVKKTRVEKVGDGYRVRPVALYRS